MVHLIYIYLIINAVFIGFHLKYWDPRKQGWTRAIFANVIYLIAALPIYLIVAAYIFVEDALERRADFLENQKRWYIYNPELDVYLKSPFNEKDFVYNAISQYTSVKERANLFNRLDSENLLELAGPSWTLILHPSK